MFSSYYFLYFHTVSTCKDIFDKNMYVARHYSLCFYLNDTAFSMTVMRAFRVI